MANGEDNVDGGYDCTFANPPPEELTCSICMHVLREPQLTTCCGHHYCEFCLRKTKAMAMRCPNCRERHFDSVLDKNYRRKVDELEVWCPNKQGTEAKDCQWMGKLKDVTNHLKTTCLFAQENCTYCEMPIQRRHLKIHEQSCPKRPYTCPYCELEATYEEIHEQHYHTCPKFPVQCPNKCERLNIERRLVQEHMETSCPLQVVPCKHARQGCPVKVPRKEMASHVKNNAHKHLELVVEGSLREAKEKDKQIQSLTERGKKTDRYVAELEVKLKEQLQRVEELAREVRMLSVKVESEVCVAPVRFCMDVFHELKRTGQRWHSPAFYSAMDGYKLRLTINPDSCLNTDEQLPAVSFGVWLEDGLYDDKLRWPFRGVVMLRFLHHQHTSKNSSNTGNLTAAATSAFPPLMPLPVTGDADLVVLRFNELAGVDAERPRVGCHVIENRGCNGEAAGGGKRILVARKKPEVVESYLTPQDSLNFIAFVQCDTLQAAHV